MSRMYDVSSSVLASTLRSWRGSAGSKTVVQPQKPIKLYDRENCPKCRLVREALTELNLDVEIYPCPEGGHRFYDEIRSQTPNVELPFLVDENTGEQAMGVHGIATYLYRQYRGVAAPQRYAGEGITALSSQLASLTRGSHGKTVKPARQPQQLMTLYSFESSPYTRLVRERLCEYEIAYRLINLGKQQLADVGPANARLSLKPYRPLENTKRWDFWQAHGNVQVPYLVDPNSDEDLFESADILEYLDRTYGQ